MILHHHPLILASGSAVRQQMLKAVGLQFSVELSGVDEDGLKAGFPAAMAPSEKGLALARAKALAVSARYPDAYTIGADQICALDHPSLFGGEAMFRIFDKPETYANAEAQLRALAGRTHQQHSAVVLARGTEILWEHVATAHLTMRQLTDAQIRAYVTAEAPLAACGSYKFESLGRHLFTAVDGDAAVIQGLPLQALISALHEREVIGFATTAT